MEKAWINCFNDVATPPPATPPPATPPPATPPIDEDRPTLSQKQLDKIVETRLAREKETEKQNRAKLIEQLENLQKAKGLTEKERDDLTNQIGELKNSMLTKEQLASQEKDALSKKHKTELEEATSKAKKNWELYENQSIETNILNAAMKHDAYRANQIIAVLRPITSLVEGKGEDGQGLGMYTPRVRFPDTKDGKPITLDLTVDEAVKRMKDLPEEYGNYFKSGVNGGLGGSSGQGGGGGSDKTPPKDPAKFREWYKKQRGIK